MSPLTLSATDVKVCSSAEQAGGKVVETACLIELTDLKVSLQRRIKDAIQPVACNLLAPDGLPGPCLSAVRACPSP